MPGFTFNTDDIRNAATTLRNKMADMESALNAANSQVEPLRGMQAGPRLQNDISQWDELMTKINQILQVIPEAATILDKTGDDFDATAGY